MSQGFKLPMIGKVDSLGNEYYVTRPDLPVLVDLSKVVIFIHTWEDESKGSGFGAELVIKNYTGKPQNNQENKEGGRKNQSKREVVPTETLATEE